MKIWMSLKRKMKILMIFDRFAAVVRAPKAYLQLTGPDAAHLR